MSRSRAGTAGKAARAGQGRTGTGAPTPRVAGGAAPRSIPRRGGAAPTLTRAPCRNGARPPHLEDEAAAGRCRRAARTEAGGRLQEDVRGGLAARHHVAWWGRGGWLSQLQHVPPSAGPRPPTTPRDSPATHAAARAGSNRWRRRTGDDVVKQAEELLMFPRLDVEMPRVGAGRDLRGGRRAMRATSRKGAPGPQQGDSIRAPLAGAARRSRHRRAARTQEAG